MLLGVTSIIFIYVTWQHKNGKITGSSRSNTDQKIAFVYAVQMTRTLGILDPMIKASCSITITYSLTSRMTSHLFHSCIEPSRMIWIILSSLRLLAEQKEVAAFLHVLNLRIHMHSK